MHTFAESGHMGSSWSVYSKVYVYFVQQHQSSLLENPKNKDHNIN